MGWFFQALYNDLVRYFLRSFWKWGVVTIWDYSGLSFIFDKIRRDKANGIRPTLFIWLMSIYIAMFGLATQRYETRLDRFENTLQIYVSQLGTSARAETFSALAAHQKYELPLEPNFWNPWRTMQALVGGIKQIDEEPTHQHKVKAIADIIVRFKDSLGCAPQKNQFFTQNCKRVSLSMVNLRQAKLRGGGIFFIVGSCGLTSRKLIS